jgi:rubrerythrin
MYAPQVVAELSRLYALEMDAAQAYSAAVAAVAPGLVHDELTLFWLEHQRHAIELHQAILELGHKPPLVDPDVKGVVIGALSAPRRRLTLEDVLEGMRGNEQLTNSIYAKALLRPLPPDARALVERLQTDERRHLAWLGRMVSRRIWEAGGSGAHP